MEEELTKIFKHLLIEPEAERQPTIQKITHDIPHIFSTKRNEALMHPISPKELKQAIFDILKGKSLGLDVFTTEAC
jgi:hypothetical protein